MASISLVMNSADFWSPIRISLQVALLASILVIIVGVGVARLMSQRSFAFKTWIETVIMLPLVLPPTVVGFLLLMLFGRQSGIGRLLETLFSSQVIFTWWAAVIASVVVAFPLVYQTLKAGFGSVNKEYEEAARSFGASEWKVLLYITFPLMYRSIITAYILGFARALGEFGATLMIAGNIPGKTQTLPTAIYVAVDSGNMALAWTWTGVIIGISFVMLWMVGGKGNREEH